ncbi:MAG: N-acetyl-gamma-glutamyl-phosphate reductase [Candidatus Malihini olakiniferum]
MLNTLIVGASGYTGAELVLYLNRHPQINLNALAVSEQSTDAGKRISDLHPQLKSIVDLPVQALTDKVESAKGIDIVFLATDHKVSHDLAPFFLTAGCVVFDLSGAFRVQNAEFYRRYYGFEHQHADWLAQAVYGLAEFQAEHVKQAQLIAVPGCYPTASQLALKPLVDAQLLNTDQWPVINAVSGVSGVGRKASLINSFCEVSLQPYSVFNHRHQPEIAIHLGIPVIFTPHLGNFARGILATITCRLKTSVSQQDVAEAYNNAYHDKPLVRLYDKKVSALKSVIGLPFCDISFFAQDEHLVVIATEDNLLKGAAAQAVQCLNIRFGFPEIQSLL